MARDRIDVHHHFIPPFYAARLRELGIHDAGGRELPTWSAEEALALMDRHEIARAIVSISTPGVRFDPSERGVAEARAMARRTNEFATELARAHPQRFGPFAYLPDGYAGLDASARASIDRDAAGALLPLAH